ncbi:MAG: hypothetical protein KAS23_00750, partial [Anaerohalosphaera sp.]|nr:hypothetical protein [Anaerohalosphaera sp.]
MKEDVFCDNQDRVRGKNPQHAVIIAPGAIGDCILTLPLAQFLKEKIGIGSVDMIAKSEYTDFYPGRTCINLVRSIDTIEMHRLFMDRNKFEVEQFDPLVMAFSKYDWVVSFLGDKGSDFEANL